MLACARAVLTGQRPAAAALLAGVGGEPLLQLAERHGLLRLLEPFLASLGADAAALRTVLRGRLLQQARSALTLTSELLAVVRTLDERGVPVAAFKGPALALQAYGDPSLRLFGDLDLVVPAALLENAVAALEDLGFTQQPFASPAQRRAVLRDGHHLVLVRGLATVELHWRFSKRVFGFSEELGGVWERRRRLRVRTVEVPVLGAADHMLALAIHASRGLWSVLEWTLAIAVLAHSLPEREWLEVVPRAEAWGCARALQVSLLLSEELFATPAPSGLWRRLPADAATRTLARRIAARTLAGAYSPSWYLRTQVALRRGPLRRLGFLLRALFVTTPGDWADAGDRRWTRLLASLARPARLLRRHRRRKAG